MTSRRGGGHQLPSPLAQSIRTVAGIGTLLPLVPSGRLVAGDSRASIHTEALSEGGRRDVAAMGRGNIGPQRGRSGGGRVPGAVR